MTMSYNKFYLFTLIFSGLICTAIVVRAADEGGVKLRFSMDSKSAGDPVTITVSGKVLDKATKEPIPNALVRGHIVIWKYQGPDLFDRCPLEETKTNQAGEYSLKFVTPLSMTGPMHGQDNLCVYAGAQGYETRPVYATGSVTPKNLDYKIDIALDKGKLVQGVVVDENQKPIPDAIVRMQSGLNGDWNFFDSLGRTISDKDGKFEIRVSEDQDLTGGRPWLAISKPGYGAGFYFGILKEGDLGTIIIPKGGEIQGKVVDAAGKGVANCEISVRGWPIHQMDVVRTDSEGRYVLSGIPGEPTIVKFFQGKNGSYQKPWGEVEVYARMDTTQSLKDVPNYKIMAQDDKTVTGPDIVIGNNSSVSGRLIPSKSTLVGLKGLLVRLDADWGKMVEVDADGKFFFPIVSAGKHNLTVYLPTNLRYDRGIGRTEINISPRQKLENTEIKLDDLAEARVQILDASGNPLEGITAGATFRRDGNGPWTEGTRSGPDGWAVLYLYPGGAQFVRGFDMERTKLVSGGFVEINPKPGQSIDNVRITMVEPASITLRVLDANEAPVALKELHCTIEYADGIQKNDRIKTDDAGWFEIKELVPGAMKMQLKTIPEELMVAIDRLTEIKPGEVKDLGDLQLSAIKFHQIKGKLSASQTFSNVEGFKIRLDLMEWQPMVATDAQGNFTLDKVPAGKHRLTAYLPYNLRTDRGVGHAQIEVKDGNLENVELPLETLATIQVIIHDPQGKPLEGVSAAAWWNKDHSGVFTEGTRSDKDGRATLYIYPEDEQYIGAHDWDGRYELKSDRKMTLKPGEVVKDHEVIMQPKNK
jgi:protocatechuate 3,4-dioxygenase beta subunit